MGLTTVVPAGVRASNDRWSRPMVLLHWATAILVLMALALALGRDWIDLDDWDGAMRLAHRGAGALMLASVAARLVLRAHCGRPAHLPGLPQWQARCAGILHRALYGLLVSLAVVGYLSAGTRGPVQMPGFALPALAHDRELSQTLQALHQGIAWTLLALVAAHAAAAAWHHFVLRDRVLLRMLGR